MSDNKNILLINNDAELLSIFSIFLGELGYKIKVALDKDVSEHIISEIDIDLIIIDFTFDIVKPYEIMDYIKEKYPDIPKMAILTKDMFNNNYYEKIYPYVYDVIVKPISNQEDFKKRIMRAIENRNLMIQNKKYLELVIDKSFRARMFNILSLMLNRVDNYIDQLLADLFVWKENFLHNLEQNEKLKEKVINFVNDFKDKIINLEEIIQLNEVLLSENTSEKGVNINNLIEDILKIFKELTEKNSIQIKAEYGDIKNINLESFKIVQCILHFLEEAILNFKYSSSKKKKIGIKTYLKIIDDKEFIIVQLIDNYFLNSDKLNLVISNNDEILKDIKIYIDGIGGKINIITDVKKGIRDIEIQFPVL